MTFEIVPENQLVPISKPLKVQMVDLVGESVFRIALAEVDFASTDVLVHDEPARAFQLFNDSPHIRIRSYLEEDIHNWLGQQPRNGGTANVVDPADCIPQSAEQILFFLLVIVLSHILVLHKLNGKQAP